MTHLNVIFRIHIVIYILHKGNSCLSSCQINFASESDCGMERRWIMDNAGRINRRDFIRIGASGAALAGLSCARERESNSAQPLIQKKKMGKTDMVASVVAMGGGSALSMIEKHEDALALIELAHARGINFFDSSPTYGKNRSSQKQFGEAMQPYRGDVYFTSKSKVSLSADETMQNIEKTLSDYRTDYIDLAQIHGLKHIDEVELMFTSGVLETLVKLREQGVVRYLGVTSHGHPPALTEAVRRFDFDVVQMAANASKVPFVFEFEQVGDGSFEDNTLPVSLAKGMGVRAFKLTGQRRLIAHGNEPAKAEALELIRYGLSLPVDGVTLGMNKPEHVESVARLAADFSPMTAEEMKSLNVRLAPSANALTLDYLREDYEDDGQPRPHLA